MLTRLNITLFFSFIFILSLNYCIKTENVVPLIEADYFECQNKHQWDSLTIHNELIGSWMWDSTICSTFGEKSIIESNYKLVFTGDFNLGGYKNNRLKTETSWCINGKDNSLTICTEPSVEKINGVIFLCSDKLVFANNWVDGCNFFYTKELD